MTLSKWIGTAIGLALCSANLSGCNWNSSNASTTDPAGSNSPTADLDGGWTSKMQKQLEEAIAAAPANGLKPDLFLHGGEKGPALTQAALRYASALANGYADPHKLHDVYTIDRPDVDVRQGLRKALQEGNVKAWLDSLPPQTDEYRALSQAHLHFLKLAARSKFEPVPDGHPIKPGARDPRIPRVIEALRSVGYLPATPQHTTGNGRSPSQASQPSAGTSSHYSPDLVAAIRKLQGEFGFRQDGIIGGNTIDALNAGPAYRARVLAIAMERLRWLPRKAPATRIDVNTAGSFLDFWRDGRHVDHRAVITGEPDKPTPQLQAPLYRLVAKPTWTVPKGIAANELAEKSQSWLDENNFVMKDGLYVQQSGPKNSLGLVKFDLKDDQAIYLHDTPAKSLFELPDRHRSHGCVRVENAVQLATMLARQEGVEHQFESAMQKDEQNFVQLPDNIPVRLLYETAFWDGSRVQFRPDVYGWDNNVAKALELAPGPPHQIRQPQSSDDIGP